MIQGSPNSADTPTSALKGSSSSITRSTPGGTGSSSPDNTSGSSNYHGDSGGGLTTGAKTAIGVTIPVVILLAGIAIFMLCFIRRKRRARAQSSKSTMLAAAAPGPMPPPPPGRQELAGTAGCAYQQAGQEPYYKSELLGQPLSEAPGQSVCDQTSELQGSNQQLAWNQGGSPQHIPAPNYAELAANRPQNTVASSNSQTGYAPAVSLPTQAVSPSSAQAANEPWKWDQPLYPDSH